MSKYYLRFQTVVHLQAAPRGTCSDVYQHEIKTGLKRETITVLTTVGRHLERGGLTLAGSGNTGEPTDFLGCVGRRQHGGPASLSFAL